MSDRLTQLADELESAGTAAAFTGAGVSTASGIPDFRGEGGIWEEHDPELFDIRTFEREPARFWEAMLAVLESAFSGGVSPNAAHEALAALESGGYLDGVITQNADRLHQEAGSENVIELHGNLQRVVCQSCKRRGPLEEVRERVEDGEIPPRCEECNGLLKPEAVLFGEQLPEHAVFQAHALAEKVDVFLVAGSSLIVEPAATLPKKAQKKGATLAIVNLDPTPHDEVAEYVFHEDVTEVLPALTEAVGLR